MIDYHARFLTLVDEIEGAYPVTRWRMGDVPVWPLARRTLYVDLYSQTHHDRTREKRDAWQSRPYASIVRAANFAATPLVDLWRRRSDLRHAILVPRRSHIMFLDDEHTFQPRDGAWTDTLCDPLINHFHEQGLSTFLMQRGNLRQAPRTRSSFAANTIINWGQLLAPALRRSARLAATLPDHDQVLAFLHRNGVYPGGLSQDALRNKAAAVVATAYGFERLLRIVQPSICFIVGYHWGMGHALVLACRRRGIFSVELQRAGLGARHEAYCWTTIPENGYSILPAAFWSWTQEDAAVIEAWTTGLKRPWHRSVLGGNPHMSAWFDDNRPETRASDARMNAIRARVDADLEILVALQTLDGTEKAWDALATLIETGPSRWRWWLRRHPFAAADDSTLARLLTIRRPNVLIDEASAFPLPALLRHMHVLVSLKSGAAVEAAMFGVKSIFFSRDALGIFPHLVETGKADVAEDIDALKERLENLERRSMPRNPQPRLPDVLSRLQVMAEDYATLCRSQVN